MVISKETATDIALSYREVETAEKLLAEITEAFSRRELPDIRDAFGRQHDGLELGVPSGHGGHRLFHVPWTLARPIIEAHIAFHKSRIGLLTEKAKLEITNGE
jgi:hypothetical protein